MSSFPKPPCSPIESLSASFESVAHSAIFCVRNAESRELNAAQGRSDVYPGFCRVGLDLLKGY